MALNCYIKENEKFIFNPFLNSPESSMTDGACFKCWISGLIFPKTFEQLTGNKTCDHGFVHNRIVAGRFSKMFRS